MVAFRLEEIGTVVARGTVEMFLILFSFIYVSFLSTSESWCSNLWTIQVDLLTIVHGSSLCKI